MNKVATLRIPQDILDSARLTPEDLMVEIAVHLYEEGRLSIGKARELAGMSLGDSATCWPRAGFPLIMMWKTLKRTSPHCVS